MTARYPSSPPSAIWSADRRKAT